MQNQFQTLQPWIGKILDELKKEIKHEHLSKSPLLWRAHFGTRPLNRISNEEAIAAYEKELLQGNEEIAEWVINRWVFRHGDVYEFFAERLARINPEFSEIKTLDEIQSAHILDGAEEAFGALTVYVFSVLNGVVFPKTVFDSLRESAEREETKKSAEIQERQEKESLEQMIARHQREMTRMKEKYEDKIAGVMKKYAVDVEALKKQVRSLQQRVAQK